MTPQMRRVSDGSLEERVARLEAQMETFASQQAKEGALLTRNIDKLTQMLEKQDQRLDVLERNIAWAIGAFAVVIFVINLISPAIRAAVGLPE